MLIPMMLAALTATAPDAPVAAVQDTVVPVERGTRLALENHRGEVLVTTWGRNAVQVGSTDLDETQLLAVTRSGSVLRIRLEGTRGPRDADLHVVIPAWMAIRIEGNQLDVGVRGSEGEISIETIGGDIVVEGGAGLVSARSIQGEVVVRGARGRVEAVSINEDVTLEDIAGDVTAETTNGDISLRRIRSSSAAAATVNGDIDFEGTIRDGGRYAFATHNGDVQIAVPEETNATVTVSSYHGDFESEFPVRLTGASRDRQFEFTLGSGSARLELGSFNGEILLRRP